MRVPSLAVPFTTCGAHTAQSLPLLSSILSQGGRDRDGEEEEERGLLGYIGLPVEMLTM